MEDIKEMRKEGKRLQREAAEELEAARAEHERGEEAVSLELLKEAAEKEQEALELQEQAIAEQRRAAEERHKAFEQQKQELDELLGSGE